MTIGIVRRLLEPPAGRRHRDDDVDTERDEFGREVREPIGLSLGPRHSMTNSVPPRSRSRAGPGGNASRHVGRRRTDRGRRSGNLPACCASAASGAATAPASEVSRKRRRSMLGWWGSRGSGVNVEDQAAAVRRHQAPEDGSRAEAVGPHHSGLSRRRRAVANERDHTIRHAPACVARALHDAEPGTGDEELRSVSDLMSHHAEPGRKAGDAVARGLITQHGSDARGGRFRVRAWMARCGGVSVFTRSMSHSSKHSWCKRIVPQPGGSNSCSRCSLVMACSQPSHAFPDPGPAHDLSGRSRGSRPAANRARMTPTTSACPMSLAPWIGRWRLARAHSACRHSSRATRTSPREWSKKVAGGSPVTMRRGSWH